MKILSMLLALIISTSSFADSGVQSVMDDLNYALKVEWDQKDMVFYNNQLDLFSQRIAVLKDQGMTNDELVKEIVGSIDDKQLSSEVSRMLAQLKLDNLSEEETVEIYLALKDKTYVRGASWNGQVLIKTAAIMAIVIGTAVILYNISGRKLRKLQEECNESDPDSQTNTTGCERTPG